MAVCKSCGQQVSWWKMQRQLCAACFSVEQNKERTALLDLLTEKPAHCHYVVKDIVIQPEPMKINVGDFFITSGGLVYIPYSETQYTGKLGGLGGFLIGGVAGGIAASYSDRQNLSNARSGAYQRRQDDYAMSIEDRLRKRGGIVIPLSAFRSAEAISNDIIRISHLKGSLDLAIGASIEDCIARLEEWRAGKSQDTEDTQGINLQLLSANDFLSGLTNGNIRSIVTDDALLSRASKADYLDGLFALFKRQKKSAQEKAISTIFTLPHELSLSFKNKLLSEHSRELRISLLTTLGMLPGFVSIVYLAVTVTDSSKPMTGAQTLATFATMLSLFPAIFFISSFSKYLRYSYLLKKII